MGKYTTLLPSHPYNPGEPIIVVAVSINGFDFMLWEGQPVAVESSGRVIQVQDEVVTTEVAPDYCGGPDRKGVVERLSLPDEGDSRVVRVKFPHLPVAMPMAVNEIRLAKKGVHRLNLRGR